MRNIIAAAILVSLRLGAGAQSPVSASAEHIDFDRPEAWALKYFIAVSTFTAIGPPAVRQPGSVEVGLELGWIPELDRGQRRVGFEGTTLEDLNKTPLLGRPCLLVGLPAGISAEIGWVPPVEINGGKANLIAAALERPFVESGPFTAGLRLYGQIGHAKGDFTCSKAVAAQPPGSDGNPLGCNERSRDTSTLNDAGAALTGGVNLGGGAFAHLAGGATYNDVQFQVGALTNGQPDHTLLVTHGWTGWIAGGAGFKGERTWLGLEAFYSPLIVRRPPRTDTQNDGLFNVRAVLRYRIR